MHGNRYIVEPGTTYLVSPDVDRLISRHLIPKRPSSSRVINCWLVVFFRSHRGFCVRILERYLYLWHRYTRTDSNEALYQHYLAKTRYKRRVLEVTYPKLRALGVGEHILIDHVNAMSRKVLYPALPILGCLAIRVNVEEEENYYCAPFRYWDDLCKANPDILEGRVARHWILRRYLDHWERWTETKERAPCGCPLYRTTEDKWESREFGMNKRKCNLVIVRIV